MEEYTFERLWYELNQGYQIQYTYMENRYQLSKVAKNCYSQELLTIKEKSPHPKFAMLTLKRVKELFPYMENIEYRVRSVGAPFVGIPVICDTTVPVDNNKGGYI